MCCLTRAWRTSLQFGANLLRQSRAWRLLPYDQIRRWPDGHHLYAFRAAFLRSGGDQNWLQNQGVRMRLILMTSFIFASQVSSGFVLREATLQSKAFMVRSTGGLYEALDLKSKSYTFNQIDFEQCGRQMRRVPKTLAFSCAVNINTRDVQSMLRVHLSQPVVQVPFGGVRKFVKIEVSKDARTVTFSTRLDDTGVDHQVAQFNDEFYKIQGKVAQTLFVEAMNLQTLELRTLESSQGDLRHLPTLKLSRSTSDARL